MDKARWVCFKAGVRQVPRSVLLFVFLLSGFAALVYQVVWQRSLFAIYGSNIEAVSIVVTAFMLGLGLGSFAGGKVSRDPNRPLLLYFSIVELAIGIYGLASLSIFRAVGDATAGASMAATFGLSFSLVLIPTALMGSTLPMLVAYIVRQSGNVGRSVGTLYFVNTLGSAAAAFATGVFLLKHLGQTNTVLLAAGVNAAVGGTILVMWMNRRAAPAT